jgi:hypothetical protein
MQKEAEDSGWLTIYHEWSWWYPWFRLHYKLDVNLPQGNPKLDYGWSVLPLGTSYAVDQATMGVILGDVSGLEDVFIGFALPYIAQYIALRTVGRTGVAVWVAIGLYAAFSILDTAFWYFASGNKPEFWLLPFFTVAAVTVGDLFITGLVSSVGSWLTSFGRWILGEVGHAMNSMWGSGLSFLDITAGAFLLVNFAFMISYLMMYKACLS